MRQLNQVYVSARCLLAFVGALTLATGCGGGGSEDAGTPDAAIMADATPMRDADTTGADAEMPPMDADIEAGLMDASMDEIAPSWPAGATLTISHVTHEAATLAWPLASDDIGVTDYAIYVNDVLVDATPDVTAMLSGLMPEMDYAVRIEARDAAGHETLDGPTGSLRTLEPPRPAPPPQPATMPGFFDRSRHLVEGPGAIQLGLAPDTLSPERMVRVFGYVFEPGATPLMGARVEILGEPGLGYTFTRADGRFDLLVNGGGDITLRYTRPDHIESQRLVSVRAWHSYELADDVTLVPYDSEVSTIMASASTSQVARGRVVDDGDGARQATLIFPAGTGATAVMSDGTRTPLGMLSMRLTELTVGAEGPSRMPGTMPRQIAYTYAVEISADEAVTMGAVSVELSQPAAFYLEDFIGMPVGGSVPSGYYDRERGVWVPSDDGRIVEVVGVDAGGLALLDLDGDGLAEDSTALALVGVDTAEQAQLGLLYTPGSKLWRVPITHFTPEDWNWPWGPPPGSGGPGPLGGGGGGPGGGGGGGGGGDDGSDPGGPGPSCQTGGSIILCENQTLGERFGVAGTGLSLLYQSNRVPGRREAFWIHLPLGRADSLPGPVKRIEVTVTVGSAAPMRMSQAPTAYPNRGGTLFADFEWDGHDGDSAPGDPPLPQRQSVRKHVCYVYDAVPSETRSGPERSFGRRGGAAIGGGIPSAGASRDRMEVRMCRTQRDSASLGIWDARAAGLLGLTLEQHGILDSDAGLVILGDGRTEPAQGRTYHQVGGEPLTRAFSLTWFDVTPGGEVAFDGTSDSDVHNVQILGRDGTRRDWPGTESLRYVDGSVTTVGPDGALYLVQKDAGFTTSVLLRIAPDGTSTVLAGGRPYLDCCPDGSCDTLPDPSTTGDDGPATSACLGANQEGVLVGADGTVYFGDYAISDSARVRAVTPDGRIHTVVGGGDPSQPSQVATDGGPAQGSWLRFMRPLGFSPRGQLVVWGSDRSSAVMAEVLDDGTLHYLSAGDWSAPNLDEVATGQPLSELLGTTTDGSAPSITHGGNATYLVARHRVFRWSQHDRLYPVAGNADTSWPPPSLWGEGDDAMSAWTPGPHMVVAAPDGALILAPRRCGATCFRGTLWTLPRGGLRTTDTGSVAILPDGNAWQFGLTGLPEAVRAQPEDQAVLRFTHDADGLVQSIADPAGNVVRIRRLSESHVVFTAPFGEETHLWDDDGDGYLDRLEYADDPSGRGYEFGFGVAEREGLLLTMVDRTGLSHAFDYDSDGRLTSDAAGHVPPQRLVRSAPDNGERVEGTETVAYSSFSVDHFSPEGRNRRYTVTTLGDGRYERSVRAQDGTTTSVVRRPDLTRQMTFADGTIVNASVSREAGHGAPHTATTDTLTPAGRHYTSRSDVVTTLDPSDPVGIRYSSYSSAFTAQPGTPDAVTWTRAWDAATRTWTMTTPEGRTSSVILDAQSRPTTLRVPGLDDVTHSYDARGRVTSVSQGLGAMARTTTYHYDEGAAPRAQPTSVEDALSRSVLLDYDALGRPTDSTDATGALRSLGYDDLGRRFSITPPDADAHVFSLDDHGLVSRYDPPALMSGPTPSITTRDDDGLMSGYDSGDVHVLTHRDRASGRPTDLVLAEGTFTFGYDATSGKLSDLSMPNAAGAVATHLVRDGPLLLSETWSGAVAGSLARGYDALGRLSSFTVNSTPAIILSRDHDGLLTSAGPLMLPRDAASGLPTTLSVGGVSTGFTFDGFGELTSRSTTWTGGHFDVTVGYDRAGQATSWRETGAAFTRDWSFDHDDAGRLTDVYEDGAATPTWHYDYDTAGHRIGWNVPEGNCVAPGCVDIDAQDRLLRQDAVSFGYDGAGRRTSRTDAAGTTSYRYGFLGHMRSATLPDGRVVTYQLDGLGRRVGKQVDGIQQWSLLYEDSLRPIARFDGTGTMVERYVYAGTNALAPELILRPDGSQWRVVTDAIGSVRRVVDVATGAVMQELDYGPYGNVLRDSAPGTTVFGYAGGLYDADTHLSHFGAREYDAETGLWTSKDPLLFGGGDSNLYAYALGDPVDYVDPDGGFAIVAAILFAVTVAALWGLNPTHAGDGDAATKNDVDAYTGMAIDAGIMLATPLVLGPVFRGMGRVCKGFLPAVSEETVSVFHASIADGAEILESGLSASKGSAFVSRSMNAAADALANHPDAIPGLGTIIESRIPLSIFNRVLLPLERGYHGFYPYLIESTEIVLRKAEHFDAFNMFIVR